MMQSISEAAAAGLKLPPSGFAKTSETVVCPMLPNMAGDGWGRECRLIKLHGLEQIKLVGRIQDGIKADREARAQGDKEVPQSDGESSKQWESVWMLVLGCEEPTFSPTEAAHWLSTREENGIPFSDVAQFLLFHIQQLNDEAPGLEDVANGTKMLRKLPLALQTLENAYHAGPEDLRALLEAADGSNDIASYIEKWGDIISAVAFEVVRKKAKIEADETSEQILAKLCDFAIRCGMVRKRTPEDDDEEETHSS
jgi:hypothetical protein